MAPILHTGTELFSNSESPCHPDAAHQVPTQSDLLFGRRCGLKILAILNFRNTPMPPIKFKLSQTYRSGADVI